MYVLAVDDEESVLDILVEALLFCDREVIVLKAYSARDGVNFLSMFDGEISLIVSDLNMPGGGGLRVLEENARLSNVPFLLLTGDLVSVELKSKVREINPLNDVMGKPWNIDELLLYANSILER